MQSTVRTTVPYIRWCTALRLTLVVQFDLECGDRGTCGQQISVLDARTACERRKRKSCRKALVQFIELVMLMTFEKFKNKNETQNCIGIMLDLVDKSDRVVVGTNARVVNARVVRMPEE